jgi:hypothetical protein
MSRPRSFNESVARQAALCTFWRYGYEGTSIELLSEAMAMNKQASTGFSDRNRISSKGSASFTIRNISASV